MQARSKKMNDFESYLEEIRGLSIALMSDAEIARARADYEVWASKARRTTRPLSDAATSARATAKHFGGRALTGTASQKEWAEKIRAQKIVAMPLAAAELACDPNGLGRAAKFWIENRDRTAAEIGAFLVEQRALLAQAKALHAEGKAAEYAAVAARYNALTSKWGF